MIDWLNQHGLLSQSSTQGMLTALEHANINSLLQNASTIFVRELDSKNFPKMLSQELIQGIQRSNLSGDFIQKMVDAVKREDFSGELSQKFIHTVKEQKLAHDFGKGLSGGLLEGLTEQLQDAQVIANLTKSINKSIQQMGDEMSSDIDKALGKDSKLAKKTEDVIGHYTQLVTGGYKSLESVALQGMIKAGIVSVLITAALYSVPFAIRTIERKMKRPKLIIESSQLTFIEQLHCLLHGADDKKPMEAMVFSPSLKKYLDDIVAIVSKSHSQIKAGKTNVKYRNLMLYGPPGTGKTMFAKELARCSGLEFACMSGSSFSKFQEGEAIEALDELFDWANRCNGLLIFIDEAENFLSKRENMDPQSKAYQLLNNFLNYTGQRSNKFMIVFATNHKDVLDSAMYRRIDDLVEMPLPSKQQRIDTLVLYKNKILLDADQNEASLTSSVTHYFTHALVEKIAEATKGLSYGDLEGIVNNIKTEADILEHPVVNLELINLVVDRAVKKHDDFTGGKHLGCILD